jgi:alkylhydroperoxidase family enzyme
MLQLRRPRYLLSGRPRRQLRTRSPIALGRLLVGLIEAGALVARVPYVGGGHALAPDGRGFRLSNNLFRALANSPEALREFLNLATWIRYDCQLNPRLRELAILQVGYVSSSAYEWSHHVEIGQRFGVSAADIRAITVETSGGVSGLSEVDRLVLRAARELTQDSVILPSTWSGLAEHLSGARLVDLVMVIAFYCQVVRVLSALEVEVEPAFQDHLTNFPLLMGDDGAVR